ncbi:hypothetical protein [Streptomyces roseicoloratus]|uniref:Lipoprotein n=1 Tax=Streptomyces roseicoloratus TaxID=2508722 RepID=A0ABY9S1M6_9ACTN|nr:hypothetical protein [Streptomyces roseicoloratus]WMX48321.1 hypothetical protein RGF97_30900 [Streptomyces roseicoloratus]
MSVIPRAAGALLGTAALLCVLAGCGASPAREQGATDAGRRFTAALAAGDYRTGCALLAPETRSQVEQDAKGPCGPALRELGLPKAGAARHVDVYGRDALLRMTGDTLFLSQFAGGWLVTAAGCEPRAEDEPYDCSLEGG